MNALRKEQIADGRVQESFVDRGHAVFRGVLSKAKCRELHAYADTAPSLFLGQSIQPTYLTGIIERRPDLWEICSAEVLLDFLEREMGPFVQLDSAVMCSHIGSAQHGLPICWHRDKYGSVPADIAGYSSPLSVSVLIYLQDMVDTSGPLLTLPGSHRLPIFLDSSSTSSPKIPHEAISVSAGDAVVVHHRLIHSASTPARGTARRFVGFTYNKSFMRQEDPFSGPVCSQIRQAALSANAKRQMRLLGIDADMNARLNSGFLSPELDQFSEWAIVDSKMRDEKHVR